MLATDNHPATRSCQRHGGCLNGGRLLAGNRFYSCYSSGTYYLILLMIIRGDSCGNADDFEGERDIAD